MEGLMKKLKAAGLIVFTVVTVMAFNIKEAKADVVSQKNNSIGIHSTKIVSNKIIKVPESKAKREQMSRGSSTSASLVEYSYKFIGKPYVWGATGPNSFDCSGFTSYVYRKFGYYLPHYTGAQVEMGSAVNKKNLKSGDLVFFNTTGSNSHVGIYIGNGRFIHASSGKDQVTISNLGDSYYSSRYSAARRIIK